MTLPASGLITMQDIHNEFGYGFNLNAYRGKKWWRDDNSQGFFSTGAILFSDFHGKRGSTPVFSGVWDQSTPGSYPFTIPIHDWITVEVWGAGGGGGAFGVQGADGGNGGQSVFADIWGGGGGGGGAGYIGFNGPDGSPGPATGHNAVPGGGSPGGAGFYYTNPSTGATYYTGGGGRGGYANGAWNTGHFGYGGVIQVTVGAGGAGGTSHLQHIPGNPGLHGRVRIAWGMN